MLGGRAAMHRLLAADPDIDGVFVANDLMALGALQAAGDAGRRVPEDIAVVGFDDSPLAAEARPAITTVRQPIVEMGAALAGRLLDGIEQDRALPPLVLSTELVIRQST
jgi:DNA-binding LacI/PurR family transcriptional regulator